PSTLKRVAAAPARPDPPPQWRHALAPWRPYLYSLGIESRQRAVYALEQVDQLLALALAQSGQRLTARLLRDPPYALDDRLGRLAQKQTVGTTIDRVRPTFYPTVLLHAVEGSHQRHGIGFSKLGQSRLADALVAREVRQHLAMGQRQFEFVGVALKSLRGQAGYVPHQKAEISQLIHDRCTLGAVNAQKISRQIQKNQLL